MTNAPHTGGGSGVPACRPTASSCPAPPLAPRSDPLARLATPLGLHPTVLGLLYGGGRLLKTVLPSLDDALLTAAALIAFIYVPCALAQRFAFRESWWRANGKAGAVLLLLATWPENALWVLIGLASLGALSLRQRSQSPRQNRPSAR